MTATGNVTRRRKSILSEYIYFLRKHKMWWLAPTILAMILLGGLLFLAGTGAAPLIYALF